MLNNHIGIIIHHLCKLKKSPYPDLPRAQRNLNLKNETGIIFLI